MWWQVALLNLSVPFIAQFNLGLSFVIEKHLVNLLVLGVIPGTNARIEYYHYLTLLAVGLVLWLVYKHKKNLAKNHLTHSQNWIGSQSI